MIPLIGKGLTRKPNQVPVAPFFPKPHANSSQGKVGGASVAYSGVKENLCLQTCDEGIAHQTFQATNVQGSAVSYTPRNGCDLSVAATD